MNTELVDILKPPNFSKSGIIKTREEAYKNGDWLGTFNLWIAQDDPVPAIMYQQRNPKSIWAPGKLAVAVGGHYLTGENIKDGLREVQEELGKKYSFKELTFLGRRIYVGCDNNKNEKRNIVDIFIIKDNSSIATFKPDPEEVYSICLCSIRDLVKMYSSSSYSFTTQTFLSNGGIKEIKVNKDSFPYNWDNYHEKMVYLSERFLDGEKTLCY